MHKLRILVAVSLLTFPLVPVTGLGSADEMAVASEPSAPAREDSEPRASRSRNIVVSGAAEQLPRPAGQEAPIENIVVPVTSTTTALPTRTPPVINKRPRASSPPQSQPKPETKTEPAPPPPVGGSVESIARAQVGKRYVYGATGPNAFDCSGLVYWVFNQAGISVPRLTSDGYYARYTKISRAELRPGDLVVGSGHIGIYVGNGQMVHASTPRGGVKLSAITSPGQPIGYVRIG